MPDPREPDRIIVTWQCRCHGGQNQLVVSAEAFDPAALFGEPSVTNLVAYGAQIVNSHDMLHHGQPYQAHNFAVRQVTAAEWFAEEQARREAMAAAAEDAEAAAHAEARAIAEALADWQEGDAVGLARLRERVRALLGRG